MYFGKCFKCLCEICIYRQSHEEEIKLQNHQYHLDNADSIKVRKSQYNQIHRTEINQWQSEYNKRNRLEINLKKRKRIAKERASYTRSDRLFNFKQEIKDGPSYVCMSCQRALFIRGVQVLDEQQQVKLQAKCGSEFLKSIFVHNEDAEEEYYIFCHSCLIYIRRKEVPKIHVSNGLSLDKLVPELDLTELEKQLIAKSIVFMKIKKLPKNFQSGIVDRVINVPLSDEDITKVVTSLPRPPDEAGIIAVRLKRKMNLRQAHLEEFIRPHYVLRALRKLKELGNIHYKDIVINDKFMSSPEQMEVNEQEEEMDVDSESEPDSDCDDVLDAVKKCQSKQDSHTCLVPINPDEDIVMNETNETLYKKLKESGKSHEIAPGENKRPTYWCREEDFEVKAWPTLFPTGEYGLNHPRKVKISAQQYFNQRLLNIDPRCPKDMPYVFMAQQLTEQLALENQMSVAGLRGVKKQDGNAVRVHLKDPFSIFKNIKGTPKYWQAARNDLIAMVKNLGPFHVFFTLSCGEMNWSEIFVAILRRKGLKVEYIEDETGWNGNDENIIVHHNERKDKLNDFLAKMDLTKNQLMKDNVFLITRMFDDRVKSFIKNILMGPGKDKVPFKYYSYRIEIQARGKS